MSKAGTWSFDMRMALPLPWLLAYNYPCLACGGKKSLFLSSSTLPRHVRERL